MIITVNADDFGWDKSCTDAIFTCLQEGYVHTTTLMPTGESFAYAVEKITGTAFQDCVGIHLNLTEGSPMTDAMRQNRIFCDEDGHYHNGLNRYQPLSGTEKHIIYEELKTQVEACRKAGVKIHHLDSHHHIHTAPFITPIVRELMREYGIEKMRIHRNIGNIGAVKRIMKAGFNFMIQSSRYTDYFGSFEDTLEDHRIPMAKGTLEIMCHPDFSIDRTLVDRGDGSTYEEPTGTPIAELRQSLDRKIKA